MYKVLDLFCGAGGLSLGFKMADFDIIGGIDFDQEALDTHKLNFNDGFHFCGDISELDDEFVLDNFDGKVDVIIGGPPCQGLKPTPLVMGREWAMVKALEYRRLHRRNLLHSSATP